MADYPTNKGGVDTGRRSDSDRKLMRKEYKPISLDSIRKVKPKVGKLETKKAQTLKTSADAPREIIPSTPGNAGIPIKGTRVGLGSKGPIKDRVVHALNKASMAANKKYKKTEKVGIGGRKVTKEKGMFTRDVDGQPQMVREKTKTVSKRTGTMTNMKTGEITPVMTTKKTVVKGKGVMGSVIGKYKDVKRYKK